MPAIVRPVGDGSSPAITGFVARYQVVAASDDPPSRISAASMNPFRLSERRSWTRSGPHGGVAMGGRRGSVGASGPAPSRNRDRSCTASNW